MIESDWLCIEFTRTCGWEARDRPDDELFDYAALVSWAEARDAVSPAQAGQLRRTAAVHPRLARRVLQEGLELREAIYRLFAAIGRRSVAPDSSLTALNSFLAEANRHLRVARFADRYDWELAVGEDGELAQVLWPVALSAGQLLTSSELERVKLCDADDCGWLFVDSSRNLSRRWCDMSDCGNRAKARRYRERHRN